MNQKEFELTLQKGEGYKLEFKESVSNSLRKEMVAFANAGGGKILIGVKDGGEVKGTTIKQCRQIPHPGYGEQLRARGSADHFHPRERVDSDDSGRKRQAVSLFGRLFPSQFEIECQRMRAGRVSMNNIAAALGVSSGVVRRVLHNSSGGFRSLDKRGVSKPRREDYEAILERMRKQQRHLKDVCNDPDLPSYSGWSRYAKRHPEFVEKYRQVLSSQPYHMQLATGFLSPRLIDECQRLRSRGMSQKKIGDKLGVCVVTVRTALQKIRKEDRKKFA